MNDTKMVICIRKDLNMRKGKIAAQAAHAAGAFMNRQIQEARTPLQNQNASYQEKDEALYAMRLTAVQVKWLSGSYAKIVVSVDSEQELLELVQRGKAAGLTVHSVTDAGRTEFHGVPTLTCAAFGPDESEKLDAVTGQLKLL
jgi:peptidyl-tRNA hydrolase, PTH2 family